MPKISIAIPIHDMKNGEFFLERLQDSLDKQTFRDFEVVITKDGRMAENTNSAIKKCTGEIIKILYMDDYLINPDALQNLADNFKGGWYASGCVQDDNGALVNEHMPLWSNDMKQGANTIGSPSVIAFENNDPLLFDENLSWLLDCELYDRLHKRYGEPTYQNTVDVAIGVGDHQMTNILTGEEKRAEHIYVSKL